MLVGEQYNKTSKARASSFEASNMKTTSPQTSLRWHAYAQFEMICMCLSVNHVTSKSGLFSFPAIMSFCHNVILSVSLSLCLSVV